MKTYIVAGSKAQYDHFIGQLPISDNPNNYHYVSTADSLRGVSNPHGLFVGTWKQRNDIVDVVQRLLIASHAFNPKLRKILDEVQRFGLKDVLITLNGCLLSPTDATINMHLTNDRTVVIGFNTPPEFGSQIEVKTIKGNTTRYLTNGTDTHFSLPI
jgi:hypothetical protein